MRASPASAKLSIDGVPVQGNPFRGRYSRSEVHVVGATAAGYEAKYEPVSLANDVFVDVSLQPHTMATRSSSPAPIARPHRAAPASASEATAGVAAAASSQAAPAPALEVDPTGGHAVLHPIESNNPYGAP